MASWDNIFKRLADRQILLPFLENQMRADKWPDKYTIGVDTSPYYGLDENGEPDGYFHPSTHSLMSARQLYYMFNPETRDQIEREPRSVQLDMAAWVGTAVHSILQTQFTMAGLIVAPEDVEAEFVNADHHVRGRTDLVAHHPTEGPLIGEIKTRTAYKYDKQVEALPSWEAQVSLACDNLGKRYDTDFTFGTIIVVEMGWPFRMKELRVERNDKLLDAIYTKFDLVRAAIEAGVPPPCECAPDPAVMKSCSARFACWQKEK